MPNLIKKVQNIIFQNNLFDRGAKIILAVSGGPDSVCMLDIFSRLQKKYSLEQIDYKPKTFLKYWLEYTYFGPNILNIDKEIIVYVNRLSDLFLTMSRFVNHLEKKEEKGKEEKI